MKIVSFVETSWNLLSLLCYLERFSVKKVVIFTPRPLDLDIIFDSNIFEIHVICSSEKILNKVIQTFQYKALVNNLRKDNFDEFVCFSHFSPLCNYLDCQFDNTKKILIDDGFLLYNAFHPSRDYGMSGFFKRKFFKIFLGLVPKFEFVDLGKVDKAYLLFSEHWKGLVDKNNFDKIEKFTEIVNFIKLKNVSNQYFSHAYLHEIEKTKEKILDSNYQNFFLGTGLVSHGILEKDVYSSLLLRFAGKTLYKPHPSEIDLNILYPKNFDVLQSKIPAEILIMDTKIQTISGFGSTTQFFLHEVESVNSTYYLTNELFNDSFVDFLRKTMKNSIVVKV